MLWTVWQKLKKICVNFFLIRLYSQISPIFTEKSNTSSSSSSTSDGENDVKEINTERKISALFSPTGFYKDKNVVTNAEKVIKPVKLNLQSNPSVQG